MDERLTIVEHKGKKILYVDFTNMEGEALVALIKQIPAATENLPETLILADGAGSRGSMESMAAFRDIFTELGRDERAAYPVRAAGIGASGLGRILFDGLVRLSPIPIRAFGSKEEALDWLVEE